MDGSKIRMAEQFYRVVNPGVAVPAQSVLIHKLRPTDVERGVAPQQALAELQQFVEGRVLVAHFVHIDLKVLRKELGNQQHELSNPAIDTARVHRWILQNGPFHEDLVRSSRKTSVWQRSRRYTTSTFTKHITLWRTPSSLRGCGRNCWRSWSQ